MSENNWVFFRKSPRRAFTRPIGTLVQGTYCISHAYQIGEGGILIEFDQELAIMSHIVVTLIVNESAAIVVRAEVRYQRPQKPGEPKLWGFKFLNLKDEHRRAIRHYIAEKRQGEDSISI